MYNIKSYVSNSASVQKLVTDDEFVRIVSRPRSPYIINWGAGKLPKLKPRVKYVWANHPTVTAVFSDKVRLHWLVSNSPDLKDDFIETTTDIAQAKTWGFTGHSVVCRTLTRSSNGKGMHIVDPNSPDADERLVQNEEGAKVRLWSKYFKKRAEYRLHAGILPNGEFRLICIQEKRKRLAYEGDIRLRNSDGFIFRARTEAEVPHAVIETAKRVMIGMRELLPHTAFAGIDIAYNQHYDKARVIELNSAPGIGVEDANCYREFFKEYFGG